MKSLLVRAARVLALGATLLAFVPACSPAAEEEHTTVIVPQGDSITVGVNAQTRAGWRELMHALAAATTGRKIHFAGTQSFAGNAGGLAANPAHEGRPGWCVRPAASQSLLTCGSLADFAAVVSTDGATLAILAGGTNDLSSVVLNASAIDTASAISIWLDNVWVNRTTPQFQIVLYAVLRRLDAENAKVVELNALTPAVITAKSYRQNITYCPAMYDAIKRPVVGQGMADAVHPNDEGYDDMARAGWPCVQAAIGKGH